MLLNILTKVTITSILQPVVSMVFYSPQDPGYPPRFIAGNTFFHPPVQVKPLFQKQSFNPFYR